MSYKVTVEKTYPALSGNMLCNQDECFLGISIDSPYFERSSYIDILIWCADNFKKTHIIVGDYLNRYNELAKGIDIIEAQNKSILKGDVLTNKLIIAINDIGTQKFELHRWKDLFEKDILSIENLKNKFLKNEKLNTAISFHAERYAGVLKERGIIDSNNSDKIKALSREYIIEELAVFNQLFKNTDSKTFIYPGNKQLPILISFANGDFSNVSCLLENGIYMQLKVSKK